MELRSDSDPRKGCLNCNSFVGVGTPSFPYFVSKPLGDGVEELERIGNVCSKTCRDELDKYLKHK